MSEINLVKCAVARGYRTATAIAKETGLSERSTRTYLTRLIGRGLVESTPSDIPDEWSKGIKHYHMVGVKFLLQDIWGGSKKSQPKPSAKSKQKPRARGGASAR